MDTQEARMVATLAPRMINSTTKALSDILTMLERLAKTCGENKLLAALNERAKKGEEIVFLENKPIATDALSAELERKNIPHAIIEDTETGRMGCCVLAGDCREVENICNEVMISRGKQTYVEPKEFLARNLNKNIIAIPNLTEVQEHFMHEEMIRAQPKHQKHAAVFTSILDKNENTYSVIFSQEDAVICRKALNNVLCKTTSRIDQNGKYMVGISGRREAVLAQSEIDAINGVSRGISDISKPVYIVSASNPNRYLKISKTGAELYCNNNSKPQLTINPKGEDYKARVCEEMRNLIRPMVLTPEEFNNKESSIASKIPRITLEKSEEYQEVNEIRARELISLKMSLDNSNQNETLSSLYNGEVSFSEFFAHELVNDEHDDEEQQMYKRGMKSAQILDKLPEKQKALVLEYVRACSEDIAAVQSHEQTEVLTINQQEIDTQGQDKTASSLFRDNNLDVYIESKSSYNVPDFADTPEFDSDNRA